MTLYIHWHLPFYLKAPLLLKEKSAFKTKIIFIKQNSHWLSQLVNTCDRSRSSVTSNLMIECFTTIINGWKLIFKSRSRNPALFFTLIEVLIITVCNIQSMNSPVELQDLQNLFSYHLVCYITWLYARLDDLQTRLLRQIVLFLRNNSLVV